MQRHSNGSREASRNLVVIAHNIRSLWNVGSLFRSADAFGIAHLHLTGYTPVPPRPEITKTALGAEEWVQWSKANDPLTIIEHYKKEGRSILGLERAQGSTPLGQFHLSKPACLIIGNEILGIPRELLTHCDTILEIPMRGKKESLNVAVAAGIAFYQLMLRL